MDSNIFKTEGPLQVDGGSLKVPTVVLEKDGKKVALAGVAHIADRAYWESWSREIGRLLDSGKTVQMELVRSEKDLEMKKKPPLALVPIRKALSAWTGKNGFVLQKEALRKHLPRLTITDTTVEQLSKELKGDFLFLMGASFFSYPAILVMAMLDRSVIAETLHKSYFKTAAILEKDYSALSGAEARKHRMFTEIVTKRNLIATDWINRAEDGTLALWGAAHIPGIVENLEALGWRTSSVSWQTAIHG